MDFVPEKSAIDVDRIVIDQDVRAMIKDLGLKGRIKGLQQ
jgi:hypothetical protein